MELIESIKDTIGKRVNSAFSGTFILVWIGFNWRLIFILLNFDADFNFYDRLMWVDNYFLTSNKWQTLYYPIIWTFVSYIAYQLFNTITYAIGTFVNLQLKPKVLRLIKKDMIVSTNDYLKLETTYNELNIKYREEKKQFIENENNIREINMDNSKLQDSTRTLSKEVELKDLLISKYDKLENGASEVVTTQNKLIETLQKEIDNLQKTLNHSIFFIETKNNFFDLWEISIDSKITNHKKKWRGHFSNLGSSSGGVFSDRGGDFIKYIKIYENGNGLYKLSFTEISEFEQANEFYLFRINPNLYEGISSVQNYDNNPSTLILKSITHPSIISTNGTT
ncbi:MAG: hypothetical protein H7331_07265 [Bacteroidia bacterium]|nr:hypothetical protein [Bacteroidia bacterium]